MLQGSAGAGSGAGRHYLIGLTGNIATGKSTVAAMLMDLGATVIDADQVAHQVMRPGSAVFDRVVAAFGAQIIGPGQEIDRARLGRIVFDDPAALKRLESILHPPTGAAVRQRVAEAPTRVVVVEAIKLLEAGWRRICQAVWVTTCPKALQIERLVQDRALSLAQARRRVAAQPPQSEKVRVADVVIDTSGELAETRQQVAAAWEAIQEEADMESPVSYSVVRAKPGDAADIAGFVADATRGRVSVSGTAVLERFGAKGLWLVRDADEEVVALAGWRAENLIARIDDFLVFPPELYASAGKTLLQKIEDAAQELQCEVSMLFVPQRASSRLVSFYESCGYVRTEPEGLPRVWQETMKEAKEQGRYVLLKKLREDLVLRPI